MPVLGITGGAASGKSSFSKLLADRLPLSLVFSADEEVDRLTREDLEVREELERLFGTDCFNSAGEYDRPRVREQVFHSPELREKLNAILHPRVRSAWQRLALDFRNSRRWFLAEIPLLYETHSESLCDLVVTVACASETQTHRLMSNRGLSEVLAKQIKVAQSSVEEKCNKADHLIWNDCPFSCLQRQARFFADWLLKHAT